MNDHRQPSTKSDDVNETQDEETAVIHLNHAGASPCSDEVLKCYIRHLQREQNIGGYHAQEHYEKQLDEVYQTAANMVHATSKETIALVGSATVAWQRLFYAMVHAIDKLENNQEENRRKKKIILLSEAEYAANVVTACQWAQAHSDEWEIMSIPSAKDETAQSSSSGKVDVECLRQMLQGKYQYPKRLTASDSEEPAYLDPKRIALVCITHIPTNSGIVNPAELIGKCIREYNNNNNQVEKNQHGHDQNLPRIMFLLDSCQSIGQRPINVQELHCHGLVATGRKYLRGPRGTGFLYVAPELLTQAVLPFPADHFAMPVQSVRAADLCLDNQMPLNEVISFTAQKSAKRFELWESNVAGELALGAAMKDAIEQGIEQIHQTILQRVSYLHEQLHHKVPGVQVHHGKPESAICTFCIGKGNDNNKAEFLDPQKIKTRLFEATRADGHVRFAISVVPATSTPLDSSRCNVPDLLRVSVHSTTTVTEIDLLCCRLSDIVQELQSPS